MPLVRQCTIGHLHSLPSLRGFALSGSVGMTGQSAQKLQWQPIETAPKDGTEILVCGPLRDGSGVYRDVTRWPNGWSGKWPVAYMHNSDEPTHWMPLPEPPA